MVKIFCKNSGKYHKVKLGSTLLEIAQELNIQLENPIIAARVSNKVEALTFAIYKTKRIEFIDNTTSSGYRVYSRSLCMIMGKAVKEVYPCSSLRIEHPIAGGYYCYLEKNNPQEEDITITTEVIQNIKNKVQEIINKNIAIRTNEDFTESVIKIFEEQGEKDKVALLESLGTLYTEHCKIENYNDSYYGALVPSTGYIKYFDIIAYDKGMLLQMPTRKTPNEVAKFEDQPLLFKTFREFVEWNKLMKLRNIGDLNKVVSSGNITSLIQIAEAQQEKKIAHIADMIKNREKTKVILISGPSSSGKTTLSKKLSIQMMVEGIFPVVISLDNYFVNRVDTPLDENGEYDFESIHSIDLPLFYEQLEKLLKGEEVEVPTYNFKKGEREWNGKKLKLDEDNILLLEGIHALNPLLTKTIDESLKFKIYVSALTTISLDNRSWIPTTDSRLIRRIVRDAKFRGSSAKTSIDTWASVRKGEGKWIFPFQEEADVMFNSALIFELSVLRTHIEPLLELVPENCEAYTEAHRLKKFLKFCNPIWDNEIPHTSILREFLGGSSYRY